MDKESQNIISKFSELEQCNSAYLQWNPSHVRVYGCEMALWHGKKRLWCPYPKCTDLCPPESFSSIKILWIRLGESFLYITGTQLSTQARLFKTRMLHSTRWPWPDLETGISHVWYLLRGVDFSPCSSSLHASPDNVLDCISVSFKQLSVSTIKAWFEWWGRQ